MADVLLTADAPEAAVMTNRLARQGARLLDTADQVAAGRVLHMAAQNDSPLPVYLRKGAVVGVMVAPDELYELHERTEAEVAEVLTACAMKVLSARGGDGGESPSAGASGAEQDAGGQRAQREDGRGQGVAREGEDEHGAHRRRVAEEHNAGQELCSDEELREVLTQAGLLSPMLRGKTADGTFLEDLATAMLLKNRAAFAKDCKNPPVTQGLRYTLTRAMRTQLRTRRAAGASAKPSS